MNTSVTIEFELIQCGECGCHYYIPKVLYKECLETKQGFYCPNGHRRAFVRSTGEKYQELYEKEQRQKQSALQEAEMLRKQLNECNALKVVKKEKKRG